MEEQGYSVPRGHGLRGDLDTAWYEEQFKRNDHVEAQEVQESVARGEE